MLPSTASEPAHPGWQPPWWSGWLHIPVGALALVGILDIATGRVPAAPEYLMALLVVGLIVTGIVSLRTQAFVPAFCKQRPGATPRVALTFDDGPDPETTPLVLEALGNHRATFFVVGEKARAHPELIHAILAAGHQIASHGQRHSWQDLMTPKSAHRLIHEGFRSLSNLGVPSSHFFRPPYGLMVPPLAQVARQGGITVVGWSLRAFDTIRRSGPDSLASTLAARAKDGDILLLHDAPERSGGLAPLGVAAVEALVAQLRDRGFKLVTVDQLYLSGSARSENA